MHLEARVEDLQESIVPVNPHHTPSWITFVVPNTNNSLIACCERRRRYNFYNCDFHHVNRLLSDID